MAAVDPVLNERITRRGFLHLAAAAAAYKALPPIATPDNGPASAGPRELALIRDRILHLLSSATVADPTAIRSTAQKLAVSLTPNGQWPGIDYGDQSRSIWKTSSHLMNLLRMAAAYRIQADAGRPDPALGKKIDAALQWWLSNDPQNPNWWWNQIGIPKILGYTALFLHGELSAAQLAVIVKILERSNWRSWTGQNLAWGCENQVARGIVSRDPATVAQAFARMYEEVRLGAPGGDGIMPDFSFHQHGPQLYSGAYGLVFATDVGAFISFASGTPYQAPAATVDLFSRYVLDGEAWMTRGCIFDYSADGREVTRKGKSAVAPRTGITPASVGAAFRLDDVLEGLAQLEWPRSREFSGFAARLKSAPGVPQLSGNRHFWCSDYMAHQQPSFFTSVRMFSSRTINAELINSEGKQSHHLADGCTYIYATGDEYRDIFPVWDWSKIPGTTAEQMDLLQAGDNPRYETDAAFVGGVSDGSYGAAAQKLHRSALSANKFWMMFDDGFAALGSGIQCDSDRPVVTAVNQCLLRGDVIAPANANYVWHDQFAYIFPDRDKFKLTHGPQTGRWSDIGTGSDESVMENVFNLWLDHGARPANAAYAYLVLAGVSAAEAARLARGPELEILRNTPALQAVRHKRLALTGIAFWSDSRLESANGSNKLIAAVDRSCLVLLQSKARGVRLAVSNPLNEELRVNVTLPGKLAGKGATIDGNTTTVTVDLPSGVAAGSSVTRELALS
jgi:chondroitin AC lyase